MEHRKVRFYIVWRSTLRDNSSLPNRLSIFFSFPVIYWQDCRRWNKNHTPGKYTTRVDIAERVKGERGPWRGRWGGAHDISHLYKIHWQTPSSTVWWADVRLHGNICICLSGICSRVIKSCLRAAGLIQGFHIGGQTFQPNEPIGVKSLALAVLIIGVVVVAAVAIRDESSSSGLNSTY